MVQVIGLNRTRIQPGTVPGRTQDSVSLSLDEDLLNQFGFQHGYFGAHERVMTQAEIDAGATSSDLAQRNQVQYNQLLRKELVAHALEEARGQQCDPWTARSARAQWLVINIIDEGAFLQLMWLHDAPYDANTPLWDFYRGCAYASPYHSWTNQKEAHSLLMKAAATGVVMASSSLAHHWRNGTFGWIDMDRALYWYERAADAGHHVSMCAVFELMTADPRWNTDQAYRERGLDFLRRSAAMGFPGARFSQAALAIRSPGSPAVAASIDTLKDIASRLRPPHTSLGSAYILGLRYYLGIDVPPDRASAVHYLSQQNKSPDFRVGALEQYAHDMDHLLYAIQHIKGRGFEADFVRKLYLDFHTHENRVDLFKSIMHDVTAGRVRVTDELRVRVWAASKLVAVDNKNTGLWDLLSRTLDLKDAGLSEATAMRMLFDFGPMYVEAGSERFPIPFQYKREAFPGVGRFLGLTAAPTTGDIDFEFEAPNPVIGPLLSKEDVDVCLTLSFAAAEVTTPSLSVEGVNEQTYKDIRSTLREKVWSPPWLGRTQLGKTLYAADIVGALLASHGPAFAREMPRDTPAQKAMHDYLQGLPSLGGAMAGVSTRTMVHPVAMDWSWGRMADGRVSCRVNHLSMGILGANMRVRSDGTTDRNVRANDVRFAAGRAARHITAHYDAIAESLPLFERLRQLTSLHYALSELRKTGFQPSRAIESRVDRIRSKVINRPALSRHDRMIAVQL